MRLNRGFPSAAQSQSKLTADDADEPSNGNVEAHETPKLRQLELGDDAPAGDRIKGDWLGQASRLSSSPAAPPLGEGGSEERVGDESNI